MSTTIRIPMSSSIGRGSFPVQSFKRLSHHVLLQETMSGRRRQQKLSSFKSTRQVVRTSETQETHVPMKKEDLLSTATTLEKIYPKLSIKVRDEIAGLAVLDPSEDYFESLLEEIVESYSIDPEATRSLLAETDNHNPDDLSLRLPSARQLEFVHIKAAEEEFQAVGGAMMRFPCRDCGGFEFYFDPDRQIGAADEVSQSQIFCKKCKPRYS